MSTKSLTSRTPHTLTKPRAILQEIRAAEQAGYAVSDEELAIGMRSLAVPVRDGAGTIVAALSVSAYTARISRTDLQGRFLTVLHAALARLQPRL